MKNFLAALSLSLITLSAGAAPPTDESIRTLFSAMNAESIVNGIYAAIEPMMKQGMAQATAGQEPTPKQKMIMDRFSQRVGELMRTELSWKKLEPIQIRIYRESFDQAEIDGLIVFYRSPIGKSFISKMPVVTQKATAEMQIYMQQVVPKMQAAMQEMISEVNSVK
jgi:uncharacterized protein